MNFFFYLFKLVFPALVIFFKDIHEDFTYKLIIFCVQIDLSAISSMLHVSVYVFTFGDRLPEPRWTLICPDDLLYDGDKVTTDLPDIYLYHNDETHYDLIVDRDSALAVQGPVPERLERILDTPVVPAVPDNSHFINEPLLFKPCPRGRGRPKLKREGKPYLKKKK